MLKPRLKFFIDFDGTITTADVVDAILERFAGTEWQSIEQEWIAGKIGSRECLSRQMSLVSASEEEFNELVDGITIDPHFISFLQRAHVFGVPVYILSDGFDLVIRRVLNRYLDHFPKLQDDLAIFCNKIYWSRGRLTAAFADSRECGHGCANCKPLIMRRLSTKDDYVIFVGDGYSDRFAARASDIVFAKSKLLKFCEDHHIEHKRFSDFSDIENWLIRNQSLLKSRFSLS